MGAPAYAGLLLVCAPLVAALPAPVAPPRFRADTAPLRSPGFRFAAAAIMFAIMALGILDGVLPVHFASRLSQFQIGVAYTATALLVAVSSTAAGHARPRAALAVGGCGAVAGVALAGATGTVPAWAVALALIGLGAGAAETGATGVLLHAVPAERIVTAMVVWSQLAMIGYLRLLRSAGRSSIVWATPGSGCFRRRPAPQSSSRRSPRDRRSGCEAQAVCPPSAIPPSAIPPSAIPPSAGSIHRPF